MAIKLSNKNDQAQRQFDVMNSLASADELMQKIAIEKNIILKKALTSNDVDAIYKAQSYIAKTQQVNSDQPKTMLIDPLSINTGLGYQDKPLRWSLTMLRNMGKVPVVKAVIGTRIDQVCNFAQPQEDKYSTGFLIRPKKKVMGSDGEEKLSLDQQKRIEELTEFILNCGTDEVDKYRHDTFENFIKKLVKDCLELDQGCFDLTNTMAGDLFSFQAMDGATVRIADTFFKQYDDAYRERHKSEYVNGYLPYYVQIYMNRIVNHYLPWEMAMCIRNPQTDIYANGYGRSELEDLIQTVTNILNADQYNANYFKIGSNPKGILRVTGNVNTTRLEEFRQQWQAQMAGVRNAHKLPIIEADKMDFINTQTSNKDMEYARYYEFLIKITCAVYRIDPAEINFPLSGGSEQKAMFEGSNEARIKHSRDKGLKPLLRFIQSKINKHIMSRLDEEYEFKFVGLEIEDANLDLQENVQKVQNFMTVNEVRRKYGLKDLKEEEGGNEVLNPMLMNMKQQAKMAQQGMMPGQPGMQQQQEESDEVVDEEYGPEQKDENPFIKSLSSDIEKILMEGT